MMGPKAWVGDQACPRCGCWMRAHFSCGCGQCNDDYCLNCGRFSSLPLAAFIELSPMDAACAHGPTVHRHPCTEVNERIERWIEQQKAAS